MSGGSFTISNGGVFGSLYGTPIINLPQAAVLGMHNITERAVVVDGQIVIRPIMTVALTYDHRLLDGREAVTFLGACPLSPPPHLPSPLCLPAEPLARRPALVQSASSSTSRTRQRCFSSRSKRTRERERIWCAAERRGRSEAVFHDIRIRARARADVQPASPGRRAGSRGGGRPTCACSLGGRPGIWASGRRRWLPRAGLPVQELASRPSPTPLPSTLPPSPYLLFDAQDGLRPRRRAPLRPLCRLWCVPFAPSAAPPPKPFCSWSLRSSATMLINGPHGPPASLPFRNAHRAQLG